MARRGSVLGVLLWGMVAWGEPAGADPCASGVARLATGPLAVTFREGQSGVARRACSATELSVGAEGWAVIDTAHLYGQVRGAARVSGSYALGDATELFGSLEVYRYQTVIASVSGVVGGVGHLSLGGTHRFLTREGLTLGATGRLILPSIMGVYRHAWPVELDAGLTAEQSLGANWRLHAQAGVMASTTISEGPRESWLGLAVTAGAGWQPLPWLAVVADLHASAATYAPIDIIAAGLGLRFGGERLSAELGAFYPVAGRRAPIAFSLNASLRL
ncbi:hypothetical protein [Archangium sp.]|uniref:hypothetical protein n=1 Tax=Archangium sp. TaxID=1872627 RepID=UPI002D5FAEA3|nr:hypothetical protein [Archangium sp.]HYO56002.1 hypothetical protein [Archangium sp.]